MEVLLSVLKSSTSNDERKSATAELAAYQERDPASFLEYTFGIVSSRESSVDDRFFVCSIVRQFVNEMWRNVEKQTQSRFIQLYASLLTTELMPLERLTRSIAGVVGAMARRGNNKAQPGMLPENVQLVMQTYLSSLTPLMPFSEANAPAIEQVLLSIHLFIKEMEGKLVGKVFDTLCAMMVDPLSQLFASVASFSLASCAKVHLYLLKCSLRVFGKGVFNAEFYGFLLNFGWHLFNRADNTFQGADRLFHYTLKIFLSVVRSFPSQLVQLGTAFMIQPTPSEVGGGQSLLGLLCCFLESPRFRANKAEQFALTIATTLYQCEDGDAFIGECLRLFATSPLLDRLLSCIVVTYFPDPVDDEKLQEWEAEPEKALEDLDTGYDNEESPVYCAEQLFLAMTGSTYTSERCSSKFWGLFSELLSHNDDRSITAALHAIGVGYYTLSSTSDNSGYLTFLDTHLLPLLKDSADPTKPKASVFVYRRVVWVIGMWCESVLDLAHRQLVHRYLEAFIHIQTNNALVLTSLRSVENFISDNNFTLEELTPTSVDTVLATIERALTVLKSPSSVKQLAAIVYLLVEKGAICLNGEVILRLFSPVAVQFVSDYERSVAMDAETEVNIGTLESLLECLSSGVKVASDESAFWPLLDALIIPCTAPERVLAPWVEDSAWELLLQMCKFSVTYAEVSERAFQWCLRNAERDFEALPTTTRCVAALLLLRGAVVPFDQEATLTNWLQTIVLSTSPELSEACFLVSSVSLLMDVGRWQSLVLSFCFGTLVQGESQEKDYSGPVALLAFFAVSRSVMPPGVLEQVNGSTLLEQLVLLLDVTPNQLSCRCILYLLQSVSQSVPVSEEDARMVRSALENSLAMHEGEDRAFEELLLEIIGEQCTAVNTAHYGRLLALFDPLKDTLQLRGQ
ncbi:hypothetical protein ADEAN_000333900 [Angomonas deanei]|uniref:Importin N-terminal domain-containing protein n=1 Tax=Angomonas deanei TaxID=59799 RepID=A0A7G2C9Z9_9TRYP|nr:hypothetical protein ADEAN_000333900 [Angomonas deanei]